MLDSPNSPDALVVGCRGMWRVALLFVVFGRMMGESVETARADELWEAVEARVPVEGMIERVGRAYVGESETIGLVVGISRPGERRVWGFGKPLQERDAGKAIFEIGSVTKAMLGTILAEMMLRGEVGLDDPVRRHLPSDWKVPTRDGREISLLHLTTHTSSLPRLPPNLLVDSLLSLNLDDPYAAYDMEDLKAGLAAVKLEQPMGREVRYSNFGAGLLGVALARAGKYPSPVELFDERLFRPLKMVDSTLDSRDESVDMRRMMSPTDAEGEAVSRWHFSALMTAGSARSTANDLLRFGEATCEAVKTPLSPAFRMARDRWRDIEEERSMGLGWIVEWDQDGEDRPITTVWHNGGTGGYRSFVWLVPVKNMTLVVISNSEKELEESVARVITRGLLREE